MMIRRRAVVAAAVASACLLTFATAAYASTYWISWHQYASYTPSWPGLTECVSNAMWLSKDTDDFGTYVRADVNQYGAGLPCTVPNSRPAGWLYAETSVFEWDSGVLCGTGSATNGAPVSIMSHEMNWPFPYCTWQDNYGAYGWTEVYHPEFGWFEQERWTFPIVIP